jgi:hypothetical protein
MTLYGLMDLNADIELPVTISITIALFLMIVYSHFEVGLYRLICKKVELHLLYICFTVGILHSSDALGG